MNDTNKNSMDNFSLDSLDLDALGDGLSTSNDVEIDLNDFDLNDLIATNDNPMPYQSPANPDIAVNFNEFDLGTTPSASQNLTDTSTQALPEFLSSLPQDNQENITEAVEDISLDELISPEAIAAAGAVGAGVAASSLNQDEKINNTSTKPAKKGLFGKKDKASEKPKKEKISLFGGKGSGSKNTGNSPKKSGSNQTKNIIYAILAVLILGAVAWFMTNTNEEQSAPEPTPVAVPTPEPVASATSEVASEVASTATEDTSASVASATTTIIASVPMDTQSVEVASTPAITTTKPVVTAEEILSAEKPKDPAIAQEELDRLADQASQLAEQEKMIEEQLRMMNELSSKKEERIKLLEQQIAQLEQQKAQEKMEKSN